MNTFPVARARQTDVSDSPSPNTSARGHVLVVEDEHDLQELLRHHLRREGYRVSLAGDGETAVRLVESLHPDLVLLDLMLPGIDGLEVCRRIKAQHETADVPVVMLTARGEEADIVAGLELGADDYVTKPFSPRVLVARVKAVQRRLDSAGSEEKEGSAASIRVGDMLIHTDRHEVWADNQRIELTATEFRLLCLLARRPGRVFTRQQVITSIHGQLAAVTDRSVDVLVMGLRKKLGEHGQAVQTVRGVGYRLAD